MVRSKAASSSLSSSDLPSNSLPLSQGQGSTAISTGPDSETSEFQQQPAPRTEGRLLYGERTRAATSYSRHHTVAASGRPRNSSGDQSLVESSRSSNSSIDTIRTHEATSIATATTVLRVRPVVRVNQKSEKSAVSRSSPISSPPQRRRQRPPPAPSTHPPSTTTPSTSSSDIYPHRKQIPNLPYTGLNPPVLPELNLRPGSGSFSRIPASFSTPPLRQRPPSFSSPITRPPSAPPNQTGQLRPPGTRSRSHSIPRTMLERALGKAHTAVTLDHAGNFEGAMEAYEDACELLTEVIEMPGQENDREKLYDIRDTYMARIEELRQQMPLLQQNRYERSLPPRPVTEEYADGVSLYTVDDDESTLVPSNAPSLSERNAPVPPRRDSLYVAQETTARVPPLRSMPTHHINPAQLSPIRGSPPRNNIDRELRQPGNRDSFAFGAAALSPRFSPRKAADYGIRRSPSDASSKSSKSFQPSHSRQGSEEGTTSWLNTIDESGSSVGEPSPLWLRRNGDSPEPLDPIHISDEDFDAQLDAAVEAAYDDGYQVDYSYNTEEDILPSIQSPRENVERAKARVREVEREMELAVQREKERKQKFERDRMFHKPTKRDSEIAFFNDDADDESEEERMLEEMTRGYTLDFDFDLGAKSALPRESTSTQYSDGTLARGSMSSGYSSGTTWGTGHMTTSTSLSTVAETPGTPGIHGDGFDKLNFDIDDAASPTTVPPMGPPPMGPPPSLPPLPRTSMQPLPPPTNGLASAATVSKPMSVRARRLSSLAEPPEPLKIETSKTPPLQIIEPGVPTTVVQGPSPQIPPPPSAPANEPPPVPGSPLNADIKSPLARPLETPIISRPPTSHDQDTDSDGPLTMKGGRPSSPTPNLPGASGGLTAVPLQKTVSDEGLSTMPRPESPARFGYTPKLQGVPPLRQIHSSASLRSRNIVSPDTESPQTPMSNLFASSSTSNLRKGIPRSTTPGASSGFASMTPLYPPPPSAGGIDIFQNKIHSPNTLGGVMDPSDSDSPATLEPCPSEPLSRPFWLMRCFYQTIAHPKGGYISPKLFVPREVWFIKGVKLKAVDEKINACDLVTAALQRLSKCKADQINTIYEEMQLLEYVLDRAQTMLTKKLGSEVGGAGAKSLYGEPLQANGEDNMVTTKTGNIGGGKGYFSLRKLRTKTSSNTLGSTYGAGQSIGADVSYTNLPMAGAGGVNRALQPKRDVDSLAFTGPHANYLAALAKLFDAAQVLDGLAVFDESTKVPIKLRVGFELSQRHAAEFFGFFVCRFVLADITLMLDKFLKRGGEWIAQ